MAQKNYGKGTARLQTIEELKKRQAEKDAEKHKNLLREQIIFILIALLSVSPLAAAFMVKDEKSAYLLFKVGGATLVLLYPSYLLFRSLIGLKLKKG